MRWDRFDRSGMPRPALSTGTTKPPNHTLDQSSHCVVPIPTTPNKAQATPESPLPSPNLHYSSMLPPRIRSRRPAPRRLPALALLALLVAAAAGAAAADPAAGDKDGNGNGGGGLISIRLSEGVDRQDSPPAGEGQTAPPAKRYVGLSLHRTHIHRSIQHTTTSIYMYTGRPTSLTAPRSSRA